MKLDFPVQGHIYRELQKPGVDTEASTRWLVDGKLGAETEAIVVAAQDGVTHTRAYLTRVLKRGGPRECRVCEAAEETVGHMLSACKVHAWSLYKERHDRAPYLLARGACEAMGLAHHSLAQKGGRAIPLVVGEGQRVVQVDQCLPTRRNIRERRPDLCVQWADRKVLAIFDVACAWEPKISVRRQTLKQPTDPCERELEKFNKYQELAADLEQRLQGDCNSSGSGRPGDHWQPKEKSQIFGSAQTQQLMDTMQREVACAATRIIKRHMKM